MKIKTDHLEIMREAIQQFDTELNRQQYRDGRFANADKVKDLNKRYRWDLLAVAKSVLPPLWVNDTLYPYCNDSHIDSALRSIVKPL